MYFSTCSVEVSGIINKKCFVKSKSHTTCSSLAGLVPKMTMSGSCGSMVAERIIRRRRVMFGIGFVKSLHEEKEENRCHGVTLPDTNSVVNFHFVFCIDLA